MNLLEKKLRVSMGPLDTAAPMEPCGVLVPDFSVMLMDPPVVWPTAES